MDEIKKQFYRIEEYKNKHLNDDIYIIASGKSIDFIDNSFYHNKIIIGVNQIFKKIIPTYLVRKEHILLDKILNINTIHFISRGNCGNDNDLNEKYVLDKYLTSTNIVLYDHENNDCKLNELPDNNKLIVSWSTITTAIHLAAYMGAKNIILVGHDCGFIDNESNFKNYYDDNFSPDPNLYNDWLPQIESQTIKLKQQLKEKYNCNIYSLNPFINFNLEGHEYSKTIKNH